MGTDLWEAIQTGNTEAKSLASIYRQLRLLIERLNAEAEVDLAARTVITAAADKLSLSTDPQSSTNEPQSLSSEPSASGLSSFSVLPEPPPVYVAAPAAKGPYHDLIPPWEPPVPVPTPVSPTAPLPASSSNTAPVNPASVPLPDDMEVDPQPAELKDQLKQQAELMTNLLNEMQRLDKGAKSATVRDAYKQAHDAIISGLKALEDNSVPVSSPREDEKRRRVLQTIYDHSFDLDTAQHYITAKVFLVLHQRKSRNGLGMLLLLPVHPLNLLGRKD